MISATNGVMDLLRIILTLAIIVQHPEPEERQASKER
jgi:hypothetical protein